MRIRLLDVLLLVFVCASPAVSQIGLPYEGAAVTETRVGRNSYGTTDSISYTMDMFQFEGSTSADTFNLTANGRYLTSTSGGFLAAGGFAPGRSTGRPNRARSV